MRTNSVMIAFCVFVIGCCLVGTAAATKETRRGGGRKKRMKDMTVFERQSDDGLRHSPLFSLKIEGDNNEQGNEDDGFPSKMVLFNNDLYGEEDDLFKERSDYQIGYSQVSDNMYEPQKKGRVERRSPRTQKKGSIIQPCNHSEYQTCCFVVVASSLAVPLASAPYTQEEE